MLKLIDKIERLRAVIYPGGVYNADACKHTNFLTWENGSRVQLDDSSVFYKNNAGAVAILWADSVVMEYKKESNND